MAGTTDISTINDDLQQDCLVHKFVGETTLSELLANGDHDSQMTQFFYVENLRTWSKANKMIVNQNKTKEIILGYLAKQPIPCLTILSGVIERVDTLKLLGVTVSSDLCWEAHVNTICERAVSYTHLTLPTIYSV